MITPCQCKACKQHRTHNGVLLTPAEQRILDQVNRSGERVYNGRAYQQVERLKKLGLVNASFDLQPHAKGNGMTFSWEITVTRKEQA